MTNQTDQPSAIKLKESKPWFRDSITSKHLTLFLIASLFLFLISLTLSLSPKVLFSSPFQWQHWVGTIVWFLVYWMIIQKINRIDISIDPLLLPLNSLLVGWGLIMIWRLSPGFGLRQTIWLTISMLIVLLGLRLPHDLNFLRNHKYLLLISGLLLTALTLIFGTNPTGYGPRLWLGCCGFFFQPTEPLKLLLIIYLASYFADQQPFIARTIPLIAPTLLLIGISISLLIVQQDLGTASIFIFIYATMIYIATGNNKLLATSLFVIFLVAIVGYEFYDVVQLRVQAWLNPWIDPSGRSYQIVQSLISIASGGFGGRGLGAGNPALVPIAYSDFIFSSIAEEFGLIGTLGLIITILLLSIRGFRIALLSANRFHRNLAIGISTYFASQSILIIGGNIRLLPLTGVTLPFVSYGGSSLLTSFIAFLLLVQISAYSPQIPPSIKQTKPILLLSNLMIIGLVSAAIINSWWAIWRGPDLLTRTDNARRTISDLYVKRGSILDRNGNPLNLTGGLSGNYQRIYKYQYFSPILGYTQPYYGQAGAEASLDLILRGIENQDPLVTWFHHLLYGRDPGGRDVRLTLDSALQQKASQLLPQTKGAIVLLNSESGEILILFSSPYYDANSLSENWETLSQDPNSPLLNRATQTNYPPGASLGVFMLTTSQFQGPLPEIITSLESHWKNITLTCAISTSLPTTWEASIVAGCPAPIENLGTFLGSNELQDLFSDLMFYSPPEIRLPVSEPSEKSPILQPEIAALGASDLKISPLQMALAATSISNHGLIPPLNFIVEAELDNQNWRSYLSESGSLQVFTPSDADRTALLLKNPDLPIWESSAFAYLDDGNQITWYLAGTLPEASSHYVVVVVLERPAPDLAINIGRQLLLPLVVP